MLAGEPRGSRCLFCYAGQVTPRLPQGLQPRNGGTGTTVRRTVTTPTIKNRLLQVTSTTKMAATRSKRATLALSVLLLMLGCNPCTDTVQSTAVSGDGQLAAYVYERDCGATTDVTWIVSVQKSSGKFDEDADRLFVAKGRYQVSIKWTGPRALLIDCSGCTRTNIFRQMVAEGDVDVAYNFR